VKKLFTLAYASRIGFDADDPRWVGAWWLSYLIGALLLLIITPILAGYARDIPGQCGKNTVIESHLK